MAKRKAPRKKQLETRSVLSRVQGNLKELQREAETVLSRRRAEFDRLVRRTSKELEARSKRFVSTIEKEARKRLEPVIKRLAGRALASRQEVQSLARHIRELEQVLKPHRPPKPRAHTGKPAAPNES